MSQIETDQQSFSTTSSGGGYGLAKLTAVLSLAAAPTFAFMALLTLLLHAPEDLFCMNSKAPFLTGMGPMYLLMSVLHASPWLKLFCSSQP